MAIEVRISNQETSGFSEDAKIKVEEASKTYCETLISHVKLIERNRRFPGGNPDITETMVVDAIRSFASHCPTRSRTLAIRILASILPFLTGFLYNKEALHNELNMFGFFLLVATAITFIVMSLIME